MFRKNDRSSVTPAAAREKHSPRETFHGWLNLFFLLIPFVAPFLAFYAFTQYMYVCRIQLPAGKTTVDYTEIGRAHV